MFFFFLLNLKMFGHGYLKSKVAFEFILKMFFFFFQQIV